MREPSIQIRADSEAALDEAFDRATSAIRSDNPSERGHNTQKVGVD